MKFNTIEEGIADIRSGKMVILVDDEDRENEGDLTMAAEAVTPEAETRAPAAPDLPPPWRDRSPS